MRDEHYLVSLARRAAGHAAHRSLQPVARQPPPSLLIGHPRTRWAHQWDHLELPEANFAAPPDEIGTGEVERVAELDQHVEGLHQAKRVLPSRIIDEVLDDDERATGGKGVVGRANQAHLLL